MDRRHLESDPGLHQDQPRLHALLCRNVRRTLSRRAGHPYEQGFDLQLIPGKLAEPLRWSKAKMVFVNSMSDLFHKDVSDAYVTSVVEVMQTANWHTYQVLTKRSERLAEMLRGPLGEAAAAEHIWWGVSVEDRQHGLPRIEHLRSAPATVRFLSIEPLLEDLGDVDLTGINWVIVGGESGHGARPMEKDWVLSIRDQCRAAGIPILLQAMGRRAQKQGRPVARRPDLRRAAAAVAASDRVGRPSRADCRA